MNHKVASPLLHQPEAPTQRIEIDNAPQRRAMQPPPFQLKSSEQNDSDSEYDQLMEAAESAGPGFADADPNENNNDTPVQMMKDDATKYIDDFDLEIEDTFKAIKAFVNDPNNDNDHRNGLLDAWNDGRNGNGNWVIPVPLDLQEESDDDDDDNNNHAYPELKEEYDNWDNDKDFHEIENPFGKVGLKHNRYAPYITTKKSDYGDVKVKTDYKDMINNLRKENMDDDEIAEILEIADNEALETWEATRAASMMVTAVYVAEEWRKKGAGKVFRAALRCVKEGGKDFDDFHKMFKFAFTANKGRKQVGNIIDVKTGQMDLSDLDEYEQDVYNNLSDGDVDHYIS
ncbi:MAG: hypothetical protein AAF570_25195, partial [Bacteroidota bacterium]